MRQDTGAERAAKRRFAILTLLHTHPRRYDQIVASLDQDELLDYHHFADLTAIARQQRYQFRHDLAALRLMDCQIGFERSSKCYVWHNSPLVCASTRHNCLPLACCSIPLSMLRSSMLLM